MTEYTPEELWKNVQRDGTAAAEIDRVTSGRYKRWRESWCAARFGLGYQRLIGPCSIDIEDVDEQRDYDFHLILPRDFNGNDQRCALPFQAVEVMDGHPRHAEYRNLTPEQRLAAQAQRGGTPEYGITRSREVLQGKIDKHYANPDQLHMLMFVNVNARQLRWHHAAEALEPQARTFASCWLVTEHSFCRIYCAPRFRSWLRVLHWKMIEAG